MGWQSRSVRLVARTCPVPRLSSHRPSAHRNVGPVESMACVVAREQLDVREESRAETVTMTSDPPSRY
jgi:hypothetical protein